MKERILPVIAVFSAMDGSGGAGIIADCRAIRAAGCLPLVTTTAVTAQNLDGVHACWQLSADKVQQQFAAYPAACFAAAKIGVISTAATAAAVAACLRRLAAPVVWDPVIAPTHGAAFMPPATIHQIKKHLLPLATIITPNRKELLQLADSKRVSAAIKTLFAGGCRQLLVTDIDGGGKTVRHLLFAADCPQTPLWESSSRRVNGSFHGSGCLFSSTLAARLAQGDSSIQAAAAAHQKVQQAIEKSLSLPALGKQRYLCV